MVSSNAELEHIINGCLNDKVQQKEALYKSYYGYIKGVVLRYVQDYHTVEELVNDSFIKIFSNLDTFHGKNNAADLCLSFKSWVAKIASRTAIDWLRRKKISFGHEEIQDHHGPRCLTNPPDGHSDGREIRRLLEYLPQMQRTIFNLYEIEGYSHEEIAGLLAIPVNVCRVYLSRAKTKLKALYVKNI